MKQFQDSIITILRGLLSRTDIDVHVTVPDDARFGDLTSNSALIYAKECNTSPPELARTIIEKITQSDTHTRYTNLEEKNGFINATLAVDVLTASAHTHLSNELPTDHNRSTLKPFIVEYFQNNVAKPPHVGHVRSAVIGDSLVRILRYLGYPVISDTHIGDWGTQFGLLIYAFKTMGDRAVIEKDPINELNKLYVALSKKIETDVTLHDKGKAEFLKLEQGDNENRELWQWFVDVSLKDFEHYRDVLGLLPFDYNLGESFYEQHMPAVLAEFTDKGLVKKGETGEQYVDLEEFGLGRCILIKSDGATTYHMRDFATYIYRKKEFDFARNIYVVDNRQTHHFKQLFRVLDCAGYPALSDSIHVEFGFMSLPEGPISTRKGTTVSLDALLGEATSRARAIIDEKNPDLDDKEKVATAVGLGAIKYFDLSHNRTTEIVFNWDSALSFDGNSGPYLQYTHARLRGILRRAGATDAHQFSQIDTSTLTSTERLLLRQMYFFQNTLKKSVEDYYPNIVCEYLFTLASLANTYYQQTPILQEENTSIRQFRLFLITGVTHILKTGLSLLSIDAPDAM